MKLALEELAVFLAMVHTGSLTAAAKCWCRGCRLLASPAYLSKHGMPRAAADLAHHQLQGFSAPEILNQWLQLHANGKPVQIKPTLAATRIASMVNYLTETMRAPEAVWPTLTTG